MMTLGIRTAMMASLDVMRASLELMNQSWTPVRRAKDLGTLLRFAMAGPSRRKRYPVNVEELVGKWTEAVVGMCTAHDKDTYDMHDAKADELLTPILSAPVKQIREFYAALSTRLRGDPRVPMLVWMGFEAWGETVIKNAPDEKIKTLKRKLADEIVELVESEITDQIPEAMKRALMWRDPETLKKVKQAFKEGAKPKLRGRESCLFLETEHKGERISVML